MSSPLSSYTTTTPSTSTPTSIPSRTWTPTTNAIPFHTSLTSNNGTTTNFSPARLYTLSHTTFLLSYFILRFNALVADPVRTMTEMAVPLIVAQGLWCVLCLPRSGYWDARTGGLKVEETPTAQSGKGSTKRKAGSTAAGDSIISRAVVCLHFLAHLQVPHSVLIHVLASDILSDPNPNNASPAHSAPLDPFWRPNDNSYHPHWPPIPTPLPPNRPAPLLHPRRLHRRVEGDRIRVPSL